MRYYIYTEHRAWGIISNQKCQLFPFAFLSISFFQPSPKEVGLVERAWRSRAGFFSSPPRASCAHILLCCMTNIHRNNRPLGAKHMWEIYRTHHFTKPVCFPSPPRLCWVSLRLLANISIANPFSQESLLLCLEGFVSLQAYRTLLFQLQGSLGSSQSV